MKEASKTSQQDYSWNDLTRDLALTSSMTLQEADEVVFPFRNTCVDPKAALPLFRTLFSSVGYRAKGRALVNLSHLALDDHRIEAIDEVKRKWTLMQFNDDEISGLRDDIVRDITKALNR